ncbi:hypothetical protein cyc_01251 [Cyclospora cayetanensis]|uniref:Uncharacterized protein n=1 Tax=Cyclospora cayetanensis TaxID=88456 RepID=A0A1D3D3G5_9EIME|nr:hypothetical protein cyc_01251 [Cyclospora cayetanensis]
MATAHTARGDGFLPAYFLPLRYLRVARGALKQPATALSRRLVCSPEGDVGKTTLQTHAPFRVHSKGTQQGGSFMLLVPEGTALAAAAAALCVMTECSVGWAAGGAQG